MTNAAPVEQFCRRCATIVTKVVDRSPGAARCYALCNCQDGQPVYPLHAVTDRNKDTLARRWA